MAATFAEKFEQALAEARRADPQFGLRTVARTLAEQDKQKTKTILRRLQKYRPKPGGGAAEVAPTEPTRREIEKAMGLTPDALAPEPDLMDDLAARTREAKDFAAFRAFLSAVRDTDEAVA